MVDNTIYLAHYHMPVAFIANVQGGYADAPDVTFDTTCLMITVWTDTTLVSPLYTGVIGFPFPTLI